MVVARPATRWLTCGFPFSSDRFLTSLISSSTLFHMAEKTSKLRRHNGASIRALRIKDGLKPGQFATKALMSYSTLDNIENERKEASIEALYRIAAALNVPVEAIVRDPATLVASGAAQDVA